MIYLDNAATGGKKPDNVLSAVHAALLQCANPGRSGHTLSVNCARIVQNARVTLSEFFHGYGFERVAFTKNCTEALNIAIFSALQEGGHAVTTCIEHNSVLRPLEFLKRSGRADYSVVGLNEHGNISPADIAAAVREDTKVVIVTTASNVTGAMPNLRAIREAIPPRLLFICDGAQGCGHIPLHMRETGIDALCVAGHKGMHAVQGVGALLFSERFDPEPVLFGGTGSESFNLGMPPFYPDKLESGTLNFPAISSLLEGALYARFRMEEQAQKVVALTTRTIEGLRAKREITVYSIPNPCGVVAFSHARLQSEEVATVLSQKYSIAVRGGLHCAPLMHEALGTADGGLVRVSLSAFNSRSDVTALLRGVERL